MGQDLIHDHLEEKRRGQSEELDDEGGDQDFDEQRAVFYYGRDEPADVKLIDFIQQIGSTGRQNDGLAVPKPGEFGPGQHADSFPLPGQNLRQIRGVRPLAARRGLGVSGYGAWAVIGDFLGGYDEIGAVFGFADDRQRSLVKVARFQSD